MEKVEKARPRLDAASVAVCAHVGIGADDSVARAARDRLGVALANYRRHWSMDEQWLDEQRHAMSREITSAGQHRPIEERHLPDEVDRKPV